MVRTDTYKLMIAHTAEAKNTAVDGLYNLKTDSLERINILRLSTIPQIEKEKAQELKVLLVKWLKKVNSPYYYSVKARPLGKLGANYTLYQNDVAKIKIPGITNITGLPAGSSFRILTNDTIEITTATINSTLIGTTATISGGNTQVRFEIMPAIDYTTAVSTPKVKSLNEIIVSVRAEQIEIRVDNAEFQHLKAKIFNADGRLITQSSFHSSTITLNKSIFPKGNYIVQITNGLIHKSEKFFVQ
jgi:hypothetical protein